MRKNIKTTEGIFPMPVLMIATYNEDGSIDVMNAAWGTMVSRDIVALNLTETHQTVTNIKQRKLYRIGDEFFSQRHALPSCFPRYSM